MYPENDEKQREIESDSVEQLYGKIIKEYEQTKGITVATPQKASTAWLIEQMKTENPSGWQADVNAFIEKVIAARERGGKFEVCHFVDDLIDQKYLAFLESRLAKQTDEKRRKNLAIMIEMIGSKIEFRLRAKEKGEPVAISGISQDYIPKWFFSTEKEFLKAKMSSFKEGQ